MNKNYARGRQKEYHLFHQLEKDGFLVFRSAGSHSFADLIAIDYFPVCGYPDHFRVRFIQVKLDSDLKKNSEKMTTVNTVIGPVNVELWKYGKGIRSKGNSTVKKGKGNLGTISGKRSGRKDQTRKKADKK